MLNLFYKCWALASRKFYSIYGMAGSIVVSIITITVVKNFIQSIEGIDKTALSFAAKNYFYAILYLVTTSSVITFWVIKRSVPKIGSNKIGVLFGPYHNDESREQLNDLELRLKKEIAKKDLNEIISVRRLPPNHPTDNPQNNATLLNRARARLLICGNFEEFTVKGKKMTGFTSLTISFTNLPTNAENTIPWLSDAVAGRQLGWDSENTIGRNVVADNLSEISRYIVGLCLLTDLRYEDSQAILAPLFVAVQAKYNQRRISIETRRFKDTISRAYVLSLVGEVSKKYNIELTNERLLHVDDKVIRVWADKINQALQIREDVQALLLLAILKFISKDIPASKEAIRKARFIIASPKVYLCDLSDAFLLCFEGNLRESKQLYKKVINNTSAPDVGDMNNIFSFLDQAIPFFHDKPQIRFAYALLNDEFGDRALASKEFDEFISETEGRSFFGKWNREAKFRKQRIDAVGKHVGENELTENSR